MVVPDEGPRQRWHDRDRSQQTIQFKIEVYRALRASLGCYRTEYKP